MAYGDKRDYAPIQLHDRRTGAYLGSTTWAKSLLVARQKMADRIGANVGNIGARYAK